MAAGGKGGARGIVALLLVVTCSVTLPASAAPLQLGVRASHHRSTLGTVEWRAFAEVRVAFDRLVQRSVATDPGLDTGPGESNDEDDPGSDASARGPAPVSSEAADPVEPEPLPAPVPPPSTPSIDRFDPTFARRAVEAALRAHGYSAARHRLTRMRSRVRASASLPELRFTVGRRTDESLRLTPTASDPDRFTEAGGLDSWVEGRVTWRLDRLVFASEEIAIERVLARRRAAELRLVDDVLGALIARRTAAHAASDPLALPEERVRARLELFRAEATLEVLTGGWFSGQGRSPPPGHE